MPLPDSLRAVRPARLALAALVALVATTIAYVALAAPGGWFSSAAPIAYGPDRVTVVRGVVESHDGGELRVRAREGDRVVLLSVETDIPSDRYPGVAWSALDLPDSGKVRLLWRTDVAPQRLNEVNVAVESGRPRTAVVARDQNWVGRIKGVALYVEPVASVPIRVRGVVAKPMGATDLLTDRLGEWLAFEPWTGTSINAIAGGADVQELPLPLFLAVMVMLAWCIWWPIAGRPGRAVGVAAALVLFAAAAVALDLRWTWNLARQVAQTTARFGGLDAREKHLADEDGALFEFVDRARAQMPAAPVRVFVAAEAAYYRTRAAWHLYPHNAFYDPLRDALPPATDLRPGDWILVWRRRGVQYDAAQHLLRWDNGAPVHASLRARGEGVALFELDR
jgi:hypothetical protein